MHNPPYLEIQKLFWISKGLVTLKVSLVNNIYIAMNYLPANSTWIFHVSLPETLFHLILYFQPGEEAGSLMMCGTNTREPVASCTWCTTSMCSCWWKPRKTRSISAQIWYQRYCTSIRPIRSSSSSPGRLEKVKWIFSYKIDQVIFYDFMVLEGYRLFSGFSQTDWNDYFQFFIKFL